MQTLSSRFTITVLLALAGPAFAGRPPIAPGFYTKWNGAIDQMEILRSFKLNDYAGVRVAALETKGLLLPEDMDPDERKMAQQGISEARSLFIAGINSGLTGAALQAAADPAPGDGRMIVLRCKLEELDPGSSGARRVGGGGARVTIYGEGFDSISGKKLFTFSHHRDSSHRTTVKFVPWSGGPKLLKLLRWALTNIGEDLGEGLSEFR